jgi:branched-chain amino acid transport system substrate-binding protein
MKMHAKLKSLVPILGLVGVLVPSALMAPAAIAQDVIKIGVTAPITGPFAGIYSVQGKIYEGWEKAQNEAGGIFVKDLNKKLPIKVVYYDDKGDAKVSVRFYEKLVNEDKVDFLLGPPGSPLGFGASTVAERYQFPMLMGASNDPSIFSRGFKYIQGVLALGTDWSTQYFDMVDKKGFVKNGSLKTMALLTQDVLYARGVSDGARQRAKSLGIQIVVDEVAPPNNEDFTAIIARMKAARPDLVWVGTFPPFFIKFAKQADELGLRSKVMHCSTCSAGEVGKGLGAAAQHVSGELYWDYSMKYGDRKMLDRALELSGVDPIQFTFAYIAVPQFEVLRAAIDKAGTLDREKVYKAIQEIELETVMGKYKAVGNGIGTINPFPAQWQDGKVKVIWPPEASATDYVFPRKQ